MTSSSNGWSGGQYSVFRILLGSYLLLHFGMLLPWGAELFSSDGMLPDASQSPLIAAFPNLLGVVDTPAFVAAFLASAVVASVLLLLGRFDRAAAVWLWYVGACLLGRNPLISNPALPCVGWLCLAHALLPTAPFGSWSARGRTDPRPPGPLPPGPRRRECPRRSRAPGFRGRPAAGGTFPCVG